MIQTSINPFLLYYLIIQSILSLNSVEARECFWYTDSFGRRRRRCRGLIPGILAALVVGLFVILAFMSLAFVLRRRQQRLQEANLEHAPQLPASTHHNLMSQPPPPAYPPPGYPSTHNLPPPTPYYNNPNPEKNQSIGLNPIQAPPAANIAYHHHPTYQTNP